MILSTGCSLLKEKEPDPTLDFMKRPLTPNETNELAGEVGGNWLYGQGFGEAVTAVGGVVLFPPYAIYLLGNGIISLSGYEPLYVTNLLPEEPRDGYNQFYDTVTSGPGRLSAGIAGEEYRNQEIIKERYKKILAKNDEKAGNQEAKMSMKYDKH